TKSAPWLAQRSSRLAAAEITLPGASGPQWVAAARGDYLTEDAQQMAQQLFAAHGAPLPAPQPHGRFSLWQGTEVSAARLSDHLLAAGHTPELLLLLDVADGKHASWLGHDVPMPDLDTQRWLNEHTLAAVAQLDKHSVQRLGRELEGVGGDQF